MTTTARIPRRIHSLRIHSLDELRALSGCDGLNGVSPEGRRRSPKPRCSRACPHQSGHDRRDSSRGLTAQEAGLAPHRGEPTGASRRGRSDRRTPCSQSSEEPGVRTPPFHTCGLQNHETARACCLSHQVGGALSQQSCSGLQTVASRRSAFSQKPLSSTKAVAKCPGTDLETNNRRGKLQ